MAIKISKQDLINRFTTRIKDYITASTNWVGGTGVWDSTVNGITSISTSYGGPYNRTTATDTVAQPLAVPANFNNVTQTANNAVGTIVNTLRNLLVSYANNHRIILHNTGNLTPPSYTGVAKLNDVVQGVKDAIVNDVNNAAIENNLVKGKPIKNIEIEDFIDDCKFIWQNRCLNSAVESFYYGYCHSSCHSNHSSHGSRGRR